MFDFVCNDTILLSLTPNLFLLLVLSFYNKVILLSLTPNLDLLLVLSDYKTDILF